MNGASASNNGASTSNNGASTSNNGASASNDGASASNNGASASTNDLPAGVPSHIAVRPKDLLLYDTGEHDRPLCQVIRTRSRRIPLTRTGVLEKEQKKPTGAGGRISAQALRIKDVPKALLYVVVGVLLPVDEVQEAEVLADGRQYNMEAIEDFPLAENGSWIASKSPKAVRVVAPIWTDRLKRLELFFLCNMRNGLCVAFPMPGGLENCGPNFFLYPEWTQTEERITAPSRREKGWRVKLKTWRRAYRKNNS